MVARNFFLLLLNNSRQRPGSCCLTKFTYLFCHLCTYCRLVAAAQVRLLPCLKEANHRCCCRAIKSVLLVPTTTTFSFPNHCPRIQILSQSTPFPSLYHPWVDFARELENPCNQYEAKRGKILATIQTYNTVPRTECISVRTEMAKRVCKFC